MMRLSVDFRPRTRSAYIPAYKAARQIAVVDARMRGRGDRGLGVIGDAEARHLDHGEIVGAVADRHRLFERRCRGAR